MKRAFTLIELLIVVAIIAILAAIAVPNFLEAQVRSKVARVKGELRTVELACASYSTDYGKPAPQSKSSGSGANPASNNAWGFILTDPEKSGWQGSGTITRALTTPVGYLTTYLFYDPFAGTDTKIPLDERLYTYQAYNWKWPQYAPWSNTSYADTQKDPDGNAGWNGTEWQSMYGAYFLASIGPDRSLSQDGSWSSRPGVGCVYDPTNGTTSKGNIIRSQKYAEQQRDKP